MAIQTLQTPLRQTRLSTPARLRIVAHWSLLFATRMR
jgi:hypothetical protein